MGDESNTERMCKEKRPLAARLNAVLPFAIGFALLDAWSQAVFSGPFFDASTPIDQVVKYAAAIIPGVVLALVAPRVSPLVRRRYRELLYLFGLAAFVGTAMLLLVTGGSIEGTWLTIGNFLIAAARVFLIICWLERLCTYEIADVWLCLAGAIVLGGVLNWATALLPRVPSDIVLAIFPLVSTFLLQVRPGRGVQGSAAAGVPTGDVTGDADKSGEGVAVSAPAGAVSRRGAAASGEAFAATGAPATSGDPAAFGVGLSARDLLHSAPWALLVVLCLVNIPSEALVVIELTEGAADPTGLALLGNVVLHMAVNLAAIGLAWIASRVDVKMSVYIAIPVLLAASSLLALHVSAPVDLLHSASRCASEMIRYIVMYLLIYEVHKRRTPPVFSLGLMMALVSVGLLLGYLVALVFAHDNMLLAFSFAVVLVVAMLFVFAAQGQFEFSPEALGEAGGQAQAGSSAAAASEPAPSPERVLADFGERYGLTQREFEVMELWVTGHTTAFIEEQLVISKYTVKTHVKHIYEKTGTGSKEELIQLYESFSA